jgi:uncharacterized protein (TIGR02145 family)
MKRVTPLFLIIVCAVLSSAQTYSISGVVKNSAGTGIEGATVRLGQTGISTTTGTGGNFTLTPAGVVSRTRNEVPAMQCPKVLRDGGISFLATHKGEARVMVYDCNGRLLLSHREAASQGNNILSLPRLVHGLYIYRVIVEDRQYLIKSVAGMAANSGRVPAEKTNAAAKLAKTVAAFDDALLATKDGYQLYRLEITNPDTSGIQITLLPLVTGTVTDMDGTVYRTVQIGNQFWTMENIRTKTYNDGTPVAKVTEDTAWNRSTGAYCFYDNSTDAAYQQKWGALYNWYAVGSNKLAPSGWRVATPADWDTLFAYLPAHGYSADGVMWGSEIPKSMAAKTDWLADTTAGVIGNDLTQNNSSGFSALPGGSRSSNGAFDGQGLYSYWWMNKEFDSTMAWFRRIDNSENLGMYYATDKTCGFSVRLVRVN